MHILHTESSTGWGGQEMRILREAIGMRARGHEIILAVQKGGGLVEKARQEGFAVYELSFSKKAALLTLPRLLSIFRKHEIQLVVTHSSLDAWIAGVAGRIGAKRIIRMRHLSTPIRKGINSLLLYNYLVDYVVTTSSCILPMIAERAKLDPTYLQCVPTGLDPSRCVADAKRVAEFRASLGLKASDILIGTCCFVRSWKGINTLLRTAQLLKGYAHLKWVIVGGGHLQDYVPKIAELGLEGVVQFTGHLENPYHAIAAMDIFALLSTANEGVSQASLQAAYLERPLITTSVGGLPEVCIAGKTGCIVPPFDAEKTAEAILALSKNALLRQALGSQGKNLVIEKFTIERMLDQMEKICLNFK
jgi:glycosyltransferase involved in cell wall biosynthesis